MVATQQFMTLPELRRAAQRKLPPEVWDYVCGGAATEATLRENHRAMSHFAFRPRVLRDVGQIDTSTTFLGMPLAIPIMTAPMGSMGLLDPEGDVAMARATGRMGTIHWLSSMTMEPPEAVAAAASGPLVFQLYFRGDNAWCQEILARIEATGAFHAVAFTVDNAAYGRRERDIERRRDSTEHPKALNMLSGRGRTPTLTWADVDWLRQATKLPLIIKGIQDAADARIAVEHGVAVVHVSNHGGRNLDFSPAPIELLPEVVEAVDGKAEIIVDSGFQRGTDVLKALALGARAVVIGKAAAWGLAAGGEEGLVRTLELFGIELRIAMANTGQRSLAEVRPELVRRVCRPR